MNMQCFVSHWVPGASTSAGLRNRSRPASGSFAAVTRPGSCSQAAKAFCGRDPKLPTFTNRIGSDSPSRGRPNRALKKWLEQVAPPVAEAGRVVWEAVCKAWRALVAMVQACNSVQGYRRAVRNGALALGALLAVALAVNHWGVREANRALQQQALQPLATLLDRDVKIMRVRRFNILGLAGVGPVASVEGVHVGPRQSGAERSSIKVATVDVWVSPLDSVLRGKVALGVSLARPDVSLHQCANFSWFGYPLDTPENAQNFVPGLSQLQLAERRESHSAASPSGAPPRSSAQAAVAADGGKPGGRFPASITGARLREAREVAQVSDARGHEGGGLLSGITRAVSGAWQSVWGGDRGDAGAGAGRREGPQAGPVRLPAPRVRNVALHVSAEDTKALARLRAGPGEGRPSTVERQASRAAVPKSKAKSKGKGTRGTGKGEGTGREKGKGRGVKKRRKVAQGQEAGGEKEGAEAIGAGQAVGADHGTQGPHVPIEAQRGQAAGTETSEGPEDLRLESGALTSSAGAGAVAQDTSLAMHAPGRVAAGEEGPGSGLEAKAGLQAQVPARDSHVGVTVPMGEGASGDHGTVSQDSGAEAAPTGGDNASENSGKGVEEAEERAMARAREGALPAPALPTREDMAAGVRRLPGLERDVVGAAQRVQSGLVALQSWLEGRSGAGEEGQGQGGALAARAAGSGVARGVPGPAEERAPRERRAGRDVTGPARAATRARPYRAPALAPVSPSPPASTPASRAEHSEPNALQRAAMAVAGWVVQHVPPPEVELAFVEMRDGTGYVWIHQETLPRMLYDVRGRVWLGPRYRSLSADVQARPGRRDDSQVKTTMVMPTAKRHLRFTLPKAREHHLPFQFLKDRDGRPHDAVLSGDPLAEYDTLSSRTQALKRQWGLAGDVDAPRGSTLRAKVRCRNIGVPGRSPDLTVKLTASDLHAPMVERVLELPMDVHRGTVAGELVIRAFDEDTWAFPLLVGRVRVRECDLHFWDAADDISRCDMDLLFEGKRLYFHNARGYFGAIPVYVTGDMDLNPETGQYRISAESPGVELNALRCTLGVRPTPFPAAGAAKGILHVTGPLEKPIFSGTVIAMAPTADMLASSPESWAQETMEATPGAVAAYDKVPLSRASVVFTLDTSSEMLYLHALHLEPCDGGFVNAAGRLWVAPEAEDHPQALQVHAEANHVPLGPLARRYLPPGASLPPALHLGLGNAKVAAQGSHLAPVIEVDWEAPGLQASGRVALDANLALLLRSPDLDLDAHAEAVKAPKEVQLAAVTPEEAYWAAQPLFRGVSVRAQLKNLDLLPLAAAAPPSAQDRLKAVRLRLNGAVAVQGQVAYATEAGGAPVPHEELLRRSLGMADGVAGQQDYRLPGARGEPRGSAPRWAALPRAVVPVLSGRCELRGLKLNQMGIARNMAGDMTASAQGFALAAQGHRPSESLHVQLSTMPARADSAATPGEAGEGGPAAVGEEGDGAGDRAEEVEGPAPEECGRFRVLRVPGARVTGTVVATARLPGGATQGALKAPGQPSVAGARGLGAREEAGEGGGAASGASGSPATPAVMTGGSSLSLVQGPMRVEVAVNEAASRIRLQVENLSLDELELGSLRGQVQELSSDVNFEAKAGRGTLVVQRPRVSGLQGEQLSATARWERNIVRLERSALQQRLSRYEVTGEYVIPAETPLPGSALELSATASALGAGPGAAAPPSPPALGLWRWQVSVPRAELEEVLPAARLLSRAASVAPADYDRAKAAFIEGISRAGVAAEDVRAQLEGLARQRTAAAERGHAAEAAPAGAGREGADAAPGAGGGPLPALQDLRGHWRGQIQAYGGGGGASAVDFDLDGSEWRWGEFAMDSATARGRFHTIEGWEIDELALSAGRASFRLGGNLLGPRQQAEFHVKEFPAEWLQPMMQALPPMVGAAGAPAPRPAMAGPSPPPDRAGGRERERGLLGQLYPPQLRNAVDRLPFVGGASTRVVPAGPVSGLVFLEGRLSGSKDEPQGSVRVRVLDGSLGGVLLEQAEATADVDADQRLHFRVKVLPLESPGHLKVEGSLPIQEKKPEVPESLVQRLAAPVQRLAGLPVRDPDALEVEAGVKDYGMALLTALVPEVSWQGGGAQVVLHVRGTMRAPLVEGFADIERGSVKCSVVKGDLENITASVSFHDSVIDVQELSLQTGREPGRFLLPSTQRRGTLTVRGRLPLFNRPLGPTMPVAPDVIHVDVQDLPLTVRNLYSGMLEAAIDISGSAQAPVLGGSVRATRGTLTLSPPPSGSGGASPAPSPDASLQAGLASIYTSARDHLSGRATELLKQGAQEAPVHCSGLRIQLGPELTAQYPLVLRFQLGGELVVHGPATPAQLRPTGTIYLDGGEVNLVATQLSLDRDHPNRIVFLEEQGLDPNLDISFRGASNQLVYTIQGRSSRWQDSIIINRGGASDANDRLDPKEAAQVFAKQLEASFFRNDGQFTLPSLVPTAYSVAPRIEVRGEWGKTRYRFVSTAFTPSWFSLDPSSEHSDAKRGYSPMGSLLNAIGAEAEIQLGKSLQFTLSRTPNESQSKTQWSFTWNFNPKVRLQLSQAWDSVPKVLLEYSGDGSAPTRGGTGAIL